MDDAPPEYREAWTLAGRVELSLVLSSFNKRLKVGETSVATLKSAFSEATASALQGVYLEHLERSYGRPWRTPTPPLHYPRAFSQKPACWRFLRNKLGQRVTSGDLNDLADKATPRFGHASSSGLRHVSACPMYFVPYRNRHVLNTRDFVPFRNRVCPFVAGEPRTWLFLLLLAAERQPGAGLATWRAACTQNSGCCCVY